jgi:hypothetical protein
MRCTPLVALLSLIPGTALGASFSVPLPELVGAVDYPAAIETSSDFGQQFSSIENVFIEAEAHVFATQFDTCGTIFNPQPCVHEIILLGFFAQLHTEGFPRFSTIPSHGLSYGDLRDLEGSGTDSAAFRDEFIDSDFVFLLDGRGGLTLFWNDISVNPDLIIKNVIPPSGEIFNARLIIEGAPIPEPSTGLLVAAGLGVLAAVRRFRNAT